MKRSSQYINNKSRLIKAPEINNHSLIKLDSFNPSSLKKTS